jgi:hypothetical protein
MSGYYGPGPQPGPGPGNTPGGNTPGGSRMFGFAAMALLLVATVVSFAASRSGNSQASSAIAVGNTSPVGFPSSMMFPGDSTSPDNTSPDSDTPSPQPPTTTAATDSGGQGSASPVPPATTHSPTTPAAPRTAAPVQMSVIGVRNVVYEFFDGFLYHRLSDVRAAVCPKYRYLYNGTYVTNPKGYEFQRWHSNSYTLYPGRTYVDIYVAVTLRNPRTGSVGKTWNRTWVIVLQNKKYYVCGIRS